MKNSKRAISIVESLVVILIVVTGLVGVYNVYVRSIRTVNNLENKIQAIQIAREGLEGFQNIRDTNWLRFPLDKINCWNTFNYDIACIGNTGTTGKIQGDVSYRITRDDEGRWILETDGSKDNDYFTDSFRNYFGVRQDDKGLYTQNPSGTIMPQNYTREIIVSYREINGTLNAGMNVKSIVHWLDSTSQIPNTVELEILLTNHAK